MLVHQTFSLADRARYIVNQPFFRILLAGLNLFGIFRVLIDSTVYFQHTDNGPSNSTCTLFNF